MEPEKWDPSRDTRSEVLRLYRADVPVRQIADLLGISTQRVYQQLERLRETGLLRKARR